MTLDCCKFELSQYFAAFRRFWEPTTAKRMKIDPYCIHFKVRYIEQRLKDGTKQNRSDNTFMSGTLR